jgi:GT2 family glycosyltransferase
MPDSQRDVSILIVNYKTEKLTLECLQSVYAETRKASFEIRLVDNASGDGSADAIAKAYPDVILTRSPANIGFGPGNNLAGQGARGRYVLLLNSDTVVLDGAIDTLIAFADANPKALIWGGRTLFEDRSLNKASCWRYMTLWSLFCHATGLTSMFRASDVFNREAYADWNRDSVRPVEFVSGCYLLMTRDLWEKLDGFDDRFFMYAEEADLCWRAKTHGSAPMLTPDSTIIHYGGKSDTVREDKVVKLFTGRMTFAVKHWSSRRASMARQLMVMHCVIRAGAEKLKRKDVRPWHGVLSRRAEWQMGYPEKRQD